MSTAVAGLAVSGEISAVDRATMEAIITAENVRRAALTPPWPTLLMSTAGERRVSYQAATAALATQLHRQLVTRFRASRAATQLGRQLRRAIADASTEQQQAALTALTTPTP